MSDVLTPAEKAKITRAFNAAQERKAQAAFEAESERTGGRKAKQDAKTNAVWLAKELKSDPKDKTQPKDGAKAKNQADDKIESRKRTSSSVAVADRPKKAKETPADKSGEQEVLTGGKGKSKAKVKTRKHAAPAIAIDTDDEDEPQQKTVKAKTKTATKASKTPVVPVKAVKPTAALKPAKLVPDSNSESESSDDSEEHNVSLHGPSATPEVDPSPTSVTPAPSVPAFPLSVAPDVLCSGPSSTLYPPPHLSSARRPYSTQFQAKDIQHHLDALRLCHDSLVRRAFAMHPCLTHLSTTFLPSPIADARIHDRVQPALFDVHSYPPLQLLYELIQRPGYPPARQQHLRQRAIVPLSSM
ncbi:hypothetical protein B0H14DRAFT_3586639 [Mycena olivaceomarginata]|nr:hypothetical protein B0H14DRAFT_3586639 [Mycena olivaceomarginata]